MVRHNDRPSDGSGPYDDKRGTAEGEEAAPIPSASQITELLRPFLTRPLEARVLQQVISYLQLLQKWNAVINLTAIREPEQMVTRHFGESFFAAERLLGQAPPAQIIDFGSGAGFPGMPLAMYAPNVVVDLIESRSKKATFLKEVIRTLGISNARVVEARGENYSAAADLVTMRAVEDFERSLPAAAALVAPHGRLALLIGDRQLHTAQTLLPQFAWAEAVLVPGGRARVLAVATRQA
jgi:16S rRNA (guanine527-N7)-methyltransferase